jgi:plasmid stabilization system protein ParE
MVTEKYSLVWSKRSTNQIEAIFELINEDSPKNALKVINEIVSSAEKTIKIPNFTLQINIEKIMMEATELLKNTIIE